MPTQAYRDGVLVTLTTEEEAELQAARGQAGARHGVVGTGAARRRRKLKRQLERDPLAALTTKAKDELR